MAIVKLSGTDAVRVPDEQLAALTQSLGDPGLAAAAVRAAADPDYHGQVVQAVRNGAWPSSLLGAVRDLRQGAGGGGQMPAPAAPAAGAPNMLPPEPAPRRPNLDALQQVRTQMKMPGSFGRSFLDQYLKG